MLSNFNQLNERFSYIVFAGSLCSISPKGTSDYRIEGKSVTWDQYDAKLQELGLLVKAKNFLVFQVYKADSWNT